MLLSDQVWVRTSTSGAWDKMFSTQLHTSITPLNYANADEFEEAVRSFLQAPIDDNSLSAVLPSSTAALVDVAQTREYPTLSPTPSPTLTSAPSP